jgi:hypothetical protein
MTTTLAITLLAAALSIGPRPRPAGAESSPDAGAAPLSDEDLRSQIDAYLGSIDTPISAERWRALGPRAASILEQKVTSSDAFPSRRARAIEGLAAVGSTREAKLLVGLARSDSEPYTVRAAALRGAARLLPASKAIAALRPVLEGAGSARIRAAAADALTRSGGGEGCAAVRAQVQQERPENRGHFERALRRCVR